VNNGILALSVISLALAGLLPTATAQAQDESPAPSVLYFYPRTAPASPTTIACDNSGLPHRLNATEPTGTQSQKAKGDGSFVLLGCPIEFALKVDESFRLPSSQAKFTFWRGCDAPNAGIVARSTVDVLRNGRTITGGRSGFGIGLPTCLPTETYSETITTSVSATNFSQGDTLSVRIYLPLFSPPSAPTVGNYILVGSQTHNSRVEFKQSLEYEPPPPQPEETEQGNVTATGAPPSKVLLFVVAPLGGLALVGGVAGVTIAAKRRAANRPEWMKTMLSASKKKSFAPTVAR
jgi:hypothetical protein